VENTRDPCLKEPIEAAQRALAHAGEWIATHAGDMGAVEQGARRFALTLGRAIELALLCEHAQWSLDHERDPRFAAAARLFAQTPIDTIRELPLDDAKTLFT